MVKSHKGLSCVERGRGICYQWREKGQCSKGGQCSFGHESNDRAKPSPKAEPPSEPQSSKTRGRSLSRKRNARGRSPSEKSNRLPCKYFLKGTCTKSICEYWQPSECQFCRTKSDVSSALSAHSRTGRFKNNQTKSRVAIVKSMRQLSCVSQDTELPDSTSTSRKGKRVFEPIRRCIASSKRENEGPSLGNIQVKILHQRSPYAVKFEDRSPEETARQERCARGDAWELARKIHKLKKEDKATYYSLSEDWILPAASTIRTWSARKTLTKPNWRP